MILLNFSSYLQPSWVTEEEFGMGYLELKPAPSLASKSLAGNLVAVTNGSGLNIFQNESSGGRPVSSGTQHLDTGNSVKDQALRAKTVDGRLEKTESVSLVKSDPLLAKVKVGSAVNGSDIQQSIPSASSHAGTSRSGENQRQMEESTNKTLDESIIKVSARVPSESEVLSKLFLFTQYIVLDAYIIQIIL